MTLTAAKILSVMQSYYAEHGVLPSYSTIMQQTGIASKSTVSYNMNELKAERYIATISTYKSKPGVFF